MTKLFNYLVKPNFFSLEEEVAIWKELDFLIQPGIMAGPEKTGTAIYSNGIPLKQNKGVFLHLLYQNINVSPIYRGTNKLFDGVTHDYAQLDFHNKAVLSTNNSSILVSYYEDGDHYMEHTDHAAVTALIWFFREPRQFSGGELYFPELNETVPLTHNTLLLFPSYATHTVTPIKMESTNEGQGLGRFCITRFLWCSP